MRSAAPTKRLWSASPAGPGSPRAIELARAIQSYLEGFETYWRDAYPGINAATLLELRGTPEDLARRDEIVPVVEFAALQRIRRREERREPPNCWDFATLLELAVLGERREVAAGRLTQALEHAREGWEAQTTAANLRLIVEARRLRGEPLDWLLAVLSELET